MKIKKAIIKLSASVPNVLLLLSILTSSVFFPAIVIAEEIDQLPHTEVVENLLVEEEVETLPSDEVEEILDVVGTIPLEESVDILDALIPPLDESEDILDEGISTGPIWIENGSSSTTSDVVVLGEVYMAPQNGAVSLSFTQLPEESGYLTINEIILTQEEVEVLGAISNTAYDITTDMVDGTYEYDLTLPTTSNDVDVVYAESRSDLLDGGTEIEEGVSIEGDIVEIEGLNHFTIYIVVPSIPAGITEGTTEVNATCTVELVGSDTYCYDTIQEAVDAAGTEDTIRILAPTNLGWNIRSKSATPGERPVDLACGSTTNGDYPTYGNGGRISQNWELLNAPANVLYQREWMVPESGTWTTDGGTYTNNYTPFSSFGSSEGTEGEWNTRVRAWVDIDSNSILDESVDAVSDWSNDCKVTYDRTRPTITLDSPVIDSLHAGIVDLQATGTEDLDYINFWWRAEGQTYSNVSPDRRYHYVYDNGTVFNWSLNTLDAERWGGDPSYVMDDGDYYFYAAGKDIAGNWARTDEVKITVDNTAPARPIGLEWRDHDGDIYACGDYSPRQALIPDWDNNPEGDLSHYEYSSFHPGGAQGLDEEVFYTSEFVNSWVAPTDGMYGYAVRAVDEAGNASAWALTEESLAGSCQIILDSIPPKVEVASHDDGNIVAGLQTIEGEVSDLNLSHYWFVVVDALGTTIAGPQTVYNDGPVVLPTFDWDTTGVDDGVYTIKLEARDKAGNKDPNEAPVISDPEVINDSVDWVELTVDNSAPVSTFRPDISNGVFNSPIKISGYSVDKFSHVKGVNLYYKPSHETEWKPITTILNPAVSISPTPFNWSYVWTPVQDGTFDIKASAFDALGNEEQSPVMTNITFDTTEPKVGTIHLTMDYVDKYVNGFTGFSGSARVKDSLSGINGRSCEYTLDGINWYAGDYHRRFCTFRIGRLQDAETLSINVRVTDNAGNTGEGTQLGRTVDAKLPSVKVLVQEDFYGPQTWVPFGEIIGKAHDTVSDISSVKLTIQRGTDNYYWNNMPGFWNWTRYINPRSFHRVLGTNMWTYPGPYPYSTFRNGVEYTVTPYAWDQVHIRPGVGRSDSFTWDMQAPQDPTTFSSSHEVDEYSKDNTIEVAFSGADDYGLSGIAGYYYSFSNTEETPAIDPSNWLDASENTVTSSALTDGQWWFNIRTMDNVGNITSTAHYGPFNIDTTPAVITWDTPDDDSLHNTPVLLSAHTNETMNNFRFKWKLEGETWNSGYNNNSQDTSYSYTFDPAVDGVYRLRAQGRDLAKNWSRATDITITIDTTPPIVELTSPIDNYFTNDTIVRQTWDTDATDVEHYDYRSCWNNPTAEGFCDLIYETTRTVKYRDVHNDNITFYWQVRGVDLAGNVGVWADARKITMDSIDPAGSIDSIRMVNSNNGTVYHITEWIINEDLPTIEGLADDERSGVASVLVTIDGIPSTTTILGNAWESVFSIDIPDGQHTITAVITDNAENTTTITQDLFVDTVAPRATYIQYKDGAEIDVVTDPITFVNNIGQLTFTGSYTDDLPSSELLKDSFVIFQAQDDGSFGFSNDGKLAYCSWRSEPNLVHLNGVTYNETSERIEFTNCIASLQDGEYYMAHHVYDNAIRKDIPSIHQFRDVLGLHFVVDTIAPVVGITDPADNDFVKGVVDISGFVTDTNLSHYNISIYPGGVDVHDFSLRLEQETVYGPEFGETVIYTWDTTGYPDGEYQIRLAARDLAGNRELDGDSEHVITITVDNTVPDTPSGLRRLLRSDHSIVFECGAYSPIQGMHPDWDDSTDTNFDYYEYSSFNAPNGSQGIDERRFDESIFEYNGSWTPNEGTYGFAVRTIDKAGNISEWALSAETLEGSCQITYDDTPPEIEDIIDTLDLEEGDNIPDVLAEVTDETGLQNVHYELSNVDLGTFFDTKALSGLSETINISDLVKEYALAYFGEDILTIDTFYIPEGVYTITYHAEDLAGNPSPEETLTITITNVAPIIDSFTSDAIAITEGETINFEAVFSDPSYMTYASGEEHADDAPWTYSFLPEGTASFDDTTDIPGETLTFAHTYINEGTYFAQFEVCESDVDQGEGECDDYTIEITVSNNAPTITIQGTNTAVEGDDPITLTTTLTDGNAPFTYLWSDDCTGTTDTTTFDPTTEGTYTCTVTVIDTDGDIGTDSFDITVDAPPEGDVAGTGDYRYYADGTGSGDALLADSYVPDDEVLGSDDDIQGLLDRINSCETTKKLFGYLYIDKNKNGEKEDNEKALANISLKIFIPYNDNEITVKEITTDENGYWETYLCPGDYNISVDSENLPKNIDIGDVLAVTVSEDQDETQFDIAGIDTRNFWQKYWYILLIILALGVTTTYVILSNKQEE
ncbi:hypothetical protein K8R14_04030 [bacterium]|nr:hypothetical protein [bacterium]